MRTFRIGLMVAVAIAIFMLTILSLGQEQRFWQRKVQYEVRFARTNGLRESAPQSSTDCLWVKKAWGDSRRTSWPVTLKL